MSFAKIKQIKATTPNAETDFQLNLICAIKNIGNIINADLWKDAANKTISTKGMNFFSRIYLTHNVQIAAAKI